MNDPTAYLLALAVVGGALVGLPGAWPIAAAGLAVGVALRRPLVVVLFAATLASFLAARAEASYEAVVEARDVSGQLTIATDPEPVGSGLRLDAAVDGRLVEVWAWGPHSARLRDRLAGETVAVQGRLEPLPEVAEWSRRRGIEGRLTLSRVGPWSDGALHYRVANGFRRLVEGGASGLDIEQRALFTGFVYGDDRHQSVVTADDFRAAGLTHLLAVSGQNVAFVMALSAPAVSRLGPRGRLVGIVVVLLVFATVTRFEPSVLRATAMAGVASVAAALGREASSRRILALAVAGLVLFDPPLVRSLAFQLSVLASGGILFLSAPIARRIPGPRVLATALAVTVAAQAATAPLLAATFGGVPVASVPANLVAGPVSGPIMIWGLTAGPVAGLLGGSLAALIHVPTRAMLGWVEAVAATASAAPLGELGLAHVCALGAVVASWVLVRVRAIRPVLAGLALAVCLQPAFGLARSAPLFTPIGSDAGLWRGGGAAVLVVGPESSEAALLRDLRRAGARRVEIAVFTEPDRGTPDQLEAIRARVEIGAVLGPSGASITGLEVPADGTRLTLGGLTILLTTVDGHLDAQIAEAAG